MDINKSLIQTKNKSGPRILPCGMPNNTGNIVEYEPLRRTYWDLLLRHDLNQHHKFLLYQFAIVSTEVHYGELHQKP